MGHAHGPQRVELPGFLDRCDLNAVVPGDLQGERPDAPSCAVQEQPVAGPKPTRIDERLHLRAPRQHARPSQQEVGDAAKRMEIGRVVHQATWRSALEIASARKIEREIMPIAV